MDQFTQNLKNQIEKSLGQAAPWGDVNPLVVIGLTEAILDLGLNDEQIYQAIRSFARQLAAQVHPDRHPVNVSVERQKQILGAFDVLDNRDNFARAMNEFKTLRGEDRREIQVTRQAMRALRVQMSGFEAQYAGYQADKKNLEEEWRIFEQTKKDEVLLVPKLQSGIGVLKQEADNLHRELNEARKGSRIWKHRFEHTARLFSELGNPEESASGVAALEAKWVAVAAMSHKVGFPDLSPLNEKGEIRNDFRKIALKVGVKKKDFSTIKEVWEKASERFGVLDKLESRGLPIGFALIGLSAGNQRILFGDSSFVSSRGGRVIGSVPESSSGRADLRHSIHKDGVFESLSRFLVPGRLMVSVRTLPHKKASWSLTCPAFVFYTTRAILAVG